MDNNLKNDFRSALIVMLNLSNSNIRYEDNKNSIVIYTNIESEINKILDLIRGKNIDWQYKYKQEYYQLFNQVFIGRRINSDKVFNKAYVDGIILNI